MAVNIAIDGPAGAGKSTVAKSVAAKLGYVYVDTGAMYRAIALYMLEQKINLKDEQAISDAVSHIDISIQYQGGEQQILLNGENVNGKIRSPEVSSAASVTSTYPAVRKKLTQIQQTMALNTDLVMDGRDIGTTVLPHAQVKIFLTASVETRARRRYLELTEKGETCNLEDIKKDIADRDYRDMHRKVSPLKMANDAVRIDSSDMTADEVAYTIMQIASEKTN